MTSALKNNSFERQPCRPSCFGCDGLSSAQNISHKVQIVPQKNFQDISEMKQTEDLIAAEMWNLSQQERSDAIDDIHCVGEDFKESAQMVQQALADFERVVQKEFNPFYDMAVKQNRAYVEDPKFRLKFLRSRMYDVAEAVKQMTSYLQNKATYFGTEMIARDITLNDLNEEDKKLLLSGLFHIQKERDRKGRVVMHMFGKMLSRCKPDTMIRMGHYFFYNILASCPDVQMKGLVAVYNDTAPAGEEGATIPGFDFIKEIQPFFNAVPIRYSAMHYCLHQSPGQNLAMTNAMLNIIILGLPQYARVRTRIHYGSIMELQYQLQSHGIPLTSIPFDVLGNVMSKDSLNLWFHEHCKENGLRYQVEENKEEMQDLDQWNIESLSDSSDSSFDQMFSSYEQLDIKAEPIRRVPVGAIIPIKTDVLFGKGYRLQSHPGNIRFRAFLEQHEEEYESTSSRSNRREIAIQLAKSLRSHGVRFLQKADESGECWVESSIAQSEKKIAQYFRELRKKRVKGRGQRAQV